MRDEQRTRTIPVRVKRFIITGVVLFWAWQLAYSFLMLPSGIPDNILTQQTGKLSARVLSFFYPDVRVGFTGYLCVVRINGQNILGIAKACNGLELMALYTGVLIALPGRAVKKILFSIIGIATIFLLNVARCSLLVWLHSGDARVYQFAHHYAFKLVVYFAAFYGWVLYLKYYERRNRMLKSST